MTECPNCSQLQKELAHAEIPAGHKVQPTRADILPEPRRYRTELVAWCIIAAVTAYACVDCLIFWIMR